MNAQVQSRGAAITAAGLVSSLGYDMANACAAARAGLSRATEYGDYIVDTGAGDPAGAGVTVHAMKQLTDGFEGFARLLRITTAALRQLQEASRHSYSPRTGLYLSLGDVDSETSPEQTRAFAERLFARAAEELGWSATPPLRYVTTAGHIGTAKALQAALNDFSEGTVETAVLGAIDSLLSPARLSALEDAGRLKTENTPAGLQPGEAGVFLRVDRADVVNKQSVMAWIPAVISAPEPISADDKIPPSGAGLTQLLTTAETLLDESMPRRPWIISDQNGEVRRAYDWGAALVHLAETQSRFVDPDIWYPAMSFGDTGAVCGALGIVMSVEAFRRGYAPSSVGVVLASAHESDRTAIVVAH